MNCPRRHMCWQSKRFYWEGVPRRRAVGPGNPEGLLCHVALSLGLYSVGIRLGVVFSQSFWLRVLAGGARLVQPRRMPARILAGGRTRGISFWPFLNSSGWWWLISVVFLTRTYCGKQLMRWSLWRLAGWAPVSVLPPTLGLFTYLENYICRRSVLNCFAPELPWWPRW